MIYVIYGFIVVTIFLVAFIALGTATQSGRQVRQRLQDVQSMEAVEEDEMKQPFIERAILPVYDQLFHFLERFTPKNILENYQQILLQAGLAERYTPVRILLNQFLLAGVIGLGSFIVLRYLGQMNWLLLFLLVAVSFVLPSTIIKRKAGERQKLIKNSLPDILDMLYISVEAGLSFDSAMKKTAVKMKGPLSTEINRAMEDITKGRDREEALRSIGIRTQVEDVSSFITAVIQSELLGSNIANMLRIQSRVMREKRRQRAEEEAARMPIKMLFPMIFFLFPALFIVILGPALINIIAAFANI